LRRSRYAADEGQADHFGAYMASSETPPAVNLVSLHLSNMHIGFLLMCPKPLSAIDISFW
jgi:hypothetical protein